MSNEINRLNYFNGQVLLDKDFSDEQTYHLEMRRRHNRGLHTSGVVEGLLVTKQSDDTIRVSAGMAIEAQGREIVLPADEDHTIAVEGDAIRYVTIQYHEEPTDIANDGVSPEKPTRITEKWQIAVGADAPAELGMQLILGVVTITGGVVTAISDGEPPNHRRMSGAAGGLAFRDASGAYTANIHVTGTDQSDLIFRVGPANTDPLALPERLTITSGGNVGIGTVNPQRKLQVDGSLGVNGNVYIRRSGGGSAVFDNETIYDNENDFQDRSVKLKMATKTVGGPPQPLQPYEFVIGHEIHNIVNVGPPKTFVKRFSVDHNGNTTIYGQLNVTGEIRHNNRSVYGYSDDGTPIFAKRISAPFPNGSQCFIPHEISNARSSDRILNVFAYLILPGPGNLNRGTGAVNTIQWDDEKIQLIRSTTSDAMPVKVLIIYKD